MRAKYGNHKIENRFGKFDSEIEFSRYLFLSNREKEGKISNLQRQVDYELIPTQYGKRIKHLKTKDKEETIVLEKACHYMADFVYERDGKVIVEDVKGAKFLMTSDFKIKKKLMLWVHHIAIQIVTEATFWQKD